MDFVKHYYDDVYEINEGILGDIAKAGLTGMGKLYRTLRPKIKKINNFSDVLNPSNVEAIPCSLVHSLGMLLGGDVVKWRSISKGKNILQKFILSGKEVYAKDNWAGVINPKLHEEMKEIFKLSDDWFLVSMDIYILTNNSKITLITISDPYKGDVGDKQLSPKKVEQFARKMQNCKGFISITKKSDEWFLSKFAQRFNSFITSRYNPNAEQWRGDMEAVEKSFELEPTKNKEDSQPKPDTKKVGGSKNVINLPNGKKIKLEYQFKIPSAEFDKHGYSAQASNFKTKLKFELDNIENFDTDKINGKIYSLRDGGQITLLHDKNKDVYYIVADKKGENVLVKHNI